MWACVIGFHLLRGVPAHAVYAGSASEHRRLAGADGVPCLLAFEVSLSANVLVDCVNKAVHWLKKKLRIVAEMPK